MIDSNDVVYDRHSFVYKEFDEDMQAEERKTLARKTIYETKVFLDSRVFSLIKSDYEKLLKISSACEALQDAIKEIENKEK